jgi:hypothetical protein
VPATITSTELNLENGDKQITVDILSPVGVPIPNGDYTLTFTNTGTAPATLHCWIDAGNTDLVFTTNRRRSHTVDIPATSASAIVVASYAAEKFTAPSGAISDIGDLADSSSRGPTRTGAQKPDIAAPGVAITAARANSVAGCCCDCCYDFYVDKNGTSVAAPHVAGVIALMFERNRTLDAAAIRTAITSTARDPGGAVVLPNFDWGFGKIDAAAAVGNVTPPGGLQAMHIASPSFVPGAGAADRALRQRLQGLQGFLQEFPRGHHWAAMVSHHVDEVMGLINTNRRVAAAWQRNGGPMLVHAALTLVENPAEATIPLAVGEVSLATRLNRIFDSWRRYGSSRLVDDIDRYRAEVLAFPGRSLRAILTDSSPAV